MSLWYVLVIIVGLSREYEDMKISLDDKGNEDQHKEAKQIRAELEKSMAHKSQLVNQVIVSGITGIGTKNLE